MQKQKRLAGVKLTPYLKQKLLLIPIIFLLILNIVLAGFYIYTASPLRSKDNFSEISLLQKKDMKMPELQRFFENVANIKGAVYAYELLKVAPLPENIDVHLLGHTVGDELYKQKGLDGMLYCTHDFRNACSHTIVIGEMLSNGEKALDNINTVCKKAPGGKGAYDMCYHGLGHGVFAYTGYDLEKAVAICAQNQKYKVTDREYSECVGGMIMELTGGGDHDRELWLRQKTKYISDTNPLSPCNTDMIPEEVKSLCYVYLTPHLFEVTGAKNGKPSDEALIESFKFCNQIPEDELANRNICYGGFGKEFVVLAKNRDIRTVSEITNSQMEQILHWCSLSDNTDGQLGCLLGAMGSLYWGGENPVEPVVHFCEILPNPDFRNKCFGRLTSAVKSYAKNSEEYLEFCKLIPDELQQTCEAKK